MKVIVDGLAVDYEDQGSGLVLLLLHGWGINLGTFKQLSQDLAKDMRVISVDLPGFGGSERPKETWGVAEYSRFLSQFLDKLKVNIAVLAGHSLGGQIAIYATGEGILKPNKLVLMSSAGVRNAQGGRKSAFMIIAKLGRIVTSLPFMSLLRAPLKKKLYEAAGSTDYLQSGPMADVFLKVIKEDVQSQAAKISIPALLIWGARDPETPLWHGKILAAKITNSKLEVLEGSNHFPYLDRPDEVASLIREFAGV